MNMHHSQPMTELQRQHLAHKERQRRIEDAAAKLADSKKPKPRLVFITPVAPKSFNSRLRAPLQRHLSGYDKPEWKRKAILFDAHVRRWREEAGLTRHSLKDFVRRRSVELGSDYETIVGPNRSRDAVRARQIIMWEIKQMRGERISYPEIGRLFGSRDHTTVLHAVKKIEALKGVRE